MTKYLSAARAWLSASMGDSCEASPEASSGQRYSENSRINAGHFTGSMVRRPLRILDVTQASPALMALVPGRTAIPARRSSSISVRPAGSAHQETPLGKARA